MKELTLSGTLKYWDKAREMKSLGIDVINFGNQPGTPKHVKEAAKKMLETTAAAQYTDPRGLSELREVISGKLKEENGIDADSNTEIIVTIGGKEAIFIAFLATINPGDEIIVEDPAWVSYVPGIRLTGGVPKFLPLRQKNEFKIEQGDIEKIMTPRTKMIVICNPHNPTGSILERNDLHYISDIAKDYNILVLADECYEKFVYDGHKHYSIASLPGMKKRTITVQTTTKIYNMYGWRVGWVTASDKIVEKMLMIHSHSVSCAPSIAQAAAIAALSGNIGCGDMPIPDLITQFQKQRDTMVDGLNEIPGISCVCGRGGFFVFPNFSSFGMTSRKICEYLLEKERVIATPGIEFGRHGEGHLRFLYTSPIEEIQEGLKRVKKALEEFKINA